MNSKVKRDEYEQLADPWTAADYTVLTILEEVCSPAINPDRPLAAYLADIKEAYRQKAQP